MKKFTILFFVLLATLNVFAGPNAGDPLSANQSSITEDKGCNLAAPNNLVVTNVTTNSITVQWDPVAGAIGYDVTAWEPGTTNQYPVTAIFNTITSATVLPLPANTPVEVHVAAICPSNEKSSNFSTVIGLTDVVIEIVAAGFDCNNNSQNYPSSYSLSSNSNITVNMGNNAPVYYCKVTKANTFYEAYFEMRIIDKARFHMTSGGIFGGNSNVGTFAPDYGAPTVFNFRVSSTSTGTGTLKLTPGQQSGGYTLHISNPMCGNTGIGLYDPTKDDKPEELEISEDRNFDDTGIPTTSTNISPVPFNDYLNVQFSGDGAFSTDATIRLFSVSGALIKSRTITANAENNMVELNTTDLMPGLYMVQIQTAQGSITKLVTKMMK